MTVWDFAIPIVGAAAALLWGGAMYVSHRAQALRERSFGESLRDQLNRHIAQLDYQATRGVRLASVLVTALPPMVCATAIILAGWRINDEPFSDEWVWIVGVIFLCAIGSVAGVWAAAPLGATGPVAAQAPAGGVAEGARCSVDSRLEMSAMSTRIQCMAV